MKNASLASPARPDDPKELARWLLGVVRLAEAAELRGVHVETLKRSLSREGVELRKLGKRARGCRRYEALLLPNPLGR
jgi:hypothetical protein